MAYDPMTGKYTERDDSVEKRITGLLSKDNDYMKQAETAGLQSANRRGLMNSSIGVQASQAARVSAALPIAQQEAGQSHERNMQGRSLQMQDIGQKRDIGAQREFLNTEIGSRERMQGKDITSQQYMQGRDLTSRQQLQTQELNSMRERLSMELGSRESLQAAELAAEKENLGMQLSQQERLALTELRAAEERLGMELASREGMQARDLEVEQRIANMNVAANERTAAAQIAQSYEASYAQMVATIMNNPEIPAAERQRYLDHAARIRDSNLAMVEQFYGIELEWSTPGTSAGTSGASTQPGGPSTGPGGDRYGPRMYR